MKFKNISNKVKMFKKGNSWVEIQPNEFIELNGHVENHEDGLELILETETFDLTESLDNVLEEKSEDDLKEVIIEPVTFKTDKEIMKMTKDEINDYASVIGLKSISTRMKKQTMISRLIEYIKGLIK